MPANKQQFQLPLSHTKCSLGRQPMLQAERNKAPVASAGAAQYGKSVTQREMHAPGPESGQIRLTTHIRARSMAGAGSIDTATSVAWTMLSVGSDGASW